MSKYKAKKTVVDGITFDSKKESRRYLELKFLEDAGTISHLKTQPRYDFRIDGKLMFFYRADFVYMEDGKIVVEDVKSSFTKKNPVYRIKKKIIEASHGIKINEV